MISTFSQIVFGRSPISSLNQRIMNLTTCTRMESGERWKPVWISPQNETAELPHVKLFNSLTNEKNVFRPNVGRHIEWYSCGPTVYDTSHMGHARAYISIDILRRVMKDYFKFDVHYVMNITDIDDKIIKRARQNYLFDNYLHEKRSPEQTAVDVGRALEHVQAKLAKETDEDKKKMLMRDVTSITQVVAAGPQISRDQLVVVKDQLSDLLDKEKGHSVVDNCIFEELPRFFEKDFMDDMANLNVLPPDDLTRVSEYVDKIIVFVAKIIDRGLAYETNGSVYFDTEKFDGCDEHYYAKLVPNAYGNETLLREGEGALANFDAGEKRSETDFALWKCSKPGEPSWVSPWGKGRPGWHIECSAMAGDKCGEKLDIHTGGVDLKFPHHDNELAQSEAYFSCNQWVNYFLHTGHLTISGCKMSKSLKNFVTIKDALKCHSARQLRLMFLLHSWKDTLDYSSDTMTAALSYEKMVLDFFFNVDHACKYQSKMSIAVTQQDGELERKLSLAILKVSEALCDSVDTRETMNVLRELISAANMHYMKVGVHKLNADQLAEIAVYVYKILHMLGAADDCDKYGLIRYNDKDFGRIMTDSVSVARQFVASIHELEDAASKDAIANLISHFTDQCHTQAQINFNDTTVWKTSSKVSVDAFLDCLAEFRQSIRKESIKNKWLQYLSACDVLRDKHLFNIGVRLQDASEDISAIGLMPPWAAQDKRESPANKTGPKVTPTKKKIEASVDPKEMFKMGCHEGMYSLYDSDGLPTHDSAGVELSKTKRSKLKKVFDSQKKTFDKFNNT